MHKFKSGMVFLSRISIEIVRVQLKQKNDRPRSKAFTEVGSERKPFELLVVRHSTLQGILSAWERTFTAPQMSIIFARSTIWGSRWLGGSGTPVYRKWLDSRKLDRRLHRTSSAALMLAHDNETGSHLIEEKDRIWLMRFVIKWRLLISTMFVVHLCTEPGKRAVFP